MEQEPQRQHPRPHLFTLRVWQEELGNGDAEWRGRVQNVASGDTVFFRDWSGLVATLKRLVVTTAGICEDEPEEMTPSPRDTGGAQAK